MEIKLPDLEGKKKLVVYAVKGGKRIQWFAVSAAQLWEAGKTTVLYRKY